MPYHFRNNVWGVGPKIGGNSAGLLNFGRQLCPYDLTTPWEFGTRRKSKKRQVDYQLEVTCEKRFESLSINSTQELKGGVKEILSSTPSTLLVPSYTTKEYTPKSSSIPSSTLTPKIMPECGGVRRSAALDNIFGKWPLPYMIYGTCCKIGFITLKYKNNLSTIHI